MTNLQDYIISSRLFKTFKVDDLLVVQYTCLIEDDTSEVWAHDNYFAYVLGGKKKWKTHLGEYLVGDGELLFVKKGAHTVYQYFEEEFHVLFIFLSDGIIADMIARNPHLNLGIGFNNGRIGDSVISIPLTLTFKTFFQSMLGYLTQGTPPDNNLLKLKIEELLLNISSQPGNQALKQYFFTRKSRMVDIEEVMESQFTNHLSINDFARLTARSLSSFRRDFKSIYKTTPGKWLLERRLGHARLLLETTTCAISEVADQCGFRNQSHFIKAFKSTYKVPPGNFRKSTFRVFER
ncbi:MAG TPA: AraC family transcriptional regulator [Cyclobacteriaceae bacterium]|nr:AraC family transcriptional regulator [Cyclobacteriaceae bacterium]